MTRPTRSRSRSPSTASHAARPTRSRSRFISRMATRGHLLAFATLPLLACDGADSLGSLFVSIDEDASAPASSPYGATTCVLSVAASRHRPDGLYLFAEIPQGPAMT